MAVNNRSEIVFFDVETTVPVRKGQKFIVLEFGAILVCPRKLVELESFCTLIRPADLSIISETSVKCNGITRDAVAGAPTFEEIAERIYDLLDGRIWAGHNIMRFDCIRIRDAFAEIKRPAPVPKGMIDSLHLLSHKFGRRAGDMKMATLANYFGLGIQKHRSLEDVRMNLEVLRYCATVLFMESNFPDVLPADSSSTLVRSESPGIVTRSHAQGKTYGELTPEKVGRKSVQRSSKASVNDEARKFPTSPAESHTSEADKKSFDLSQLIHSLQSTSLQPEAVDDENLGVLGSVPATNSSDLGSHSVQSQECNNSEIFLEPKDISVPSLRMTSVSTHWGNQKMMLQHKNLPLQMRCKKMKIRFGVSTKFFDPVGKPRLSIVVEPSPETCQIVEKCDNKAQELYSGFNIKSDWRPLVSRKNGVANSIPSIRINIATTGSGETATYITELYQRDSKGNTQKLAFRTLDISDLDKLFVSGRFVDADYSFDIYNYQQNAGLRLVAGRLIVDC